jgi:hypothetical protein
MCAQGRVTSQEMTHRKTAQAATESTCGPERKDLPDREAVPRQTVKVSAKLTRTFAPRKTFQNCPLCGAVSQVLFTK